MSFLHEVEGMQCVAMIDRYGSALIPEEGKWGKAKDVTDISGLTHGVGWCVP